MVTDIVIFPELDPVFGRDWTPGWFLADLLIGGLPPRKDCCAATAAAAAEEQRQKTADESPNRTGASGASGADCCTYAAADDLASSTCGKGN